MSEINRDFKGTERFSIQRCLGAGAFGTVYQTYDLERRLVVALKTLHLATPEALYCFKQEFRALADLSHPNLVSLYELMSDGEQWFFTMELVQGVNFLEYVRGIDAGQTRSNTDPSTVKVANPDTLSGNLESLEQKSGQKIVIETPGAPSSSSTYQLHLNLLRPALRQLAEGLYALHKAGKLHRDIKPSNILVTKEGRVVILDFGLVTELAPQGIHQSFNIVGTPAYMSPEQGTGNPVSEATDWYSMGVVLYEALTGRLPFTGSLFEILMQKGRSVPQPPDELVSAIPEDLNNLCLDLLHPLAEKRPSGAEVLDRLGVKTEALKQSPILPRATEFIGRNGHLALLDQAYQSMREGHSVTVYVQGYSGMGKSLLVRHFLEKLQEQDEEMVILTGRCYEQESVPYKAFDNLIDVLSRYLKSLSLTDAEMLMPRDVQALARLFPVLRQVEAVARARQKVLEIPDSQELRRRAFTALRELLSRLANKGPLILFIDDLQWGDFDSAALLGELLRPPDSPSLLLIACYRSEEVETSPFLKTFLPLRTTAGWTVLSRELIIEELERAEAKDLVLALLGKEHSTSITGSTDISEAIFEESGGNPFFINELVQYLQASQGLAQFLDTWTERSDLSGETTIITLDEVIYSRIQNLPEDVRRLLEIIAVAGRPIELKVASAAAQFNIGENASAYTALAILHAGHLVRTRETLDLDEIEVYHNRIRETVVKRLPEEVLKTYHNRIAWVLEASDRIDPERLAFHYHGAGDNEKAARYATVAAGQAAEALAFEHAARLYRLALDVGALVDSEARALHVKLGEALANAGRGAEAAEAYLAAVEGAGMAEAYEMQRRAAEQLLISGHIDEGLAVLRKFLSLVGMRLPETPKRALLSLLLRRAQIKLRGLRYQERDISQISSQDLIRIDTCWAAAVGLGNVDPIRARDFQTRHLLLALKEGEPYRIVRALALEAGFNAAYGGRSWFSSERQIQKAMGLAKRIGHPHGLALATLTAGLAANYQGRWQNAFELLEKAEAMLRETCTGVTWELDVSQIFLIRSLLWLGNLKELLRRLSAMLKNAKERGDRYAITNLQIWSYILFLIADDSVKAEEEANHAIDLWTQKGFHVQHYYHLLAEGEIALYNGKGQTFWQRLNERWPALSNSLLLRIQIIRIGSLQLHARSALAAAASDPDPRPLLSIAERDGRRIEREKVLYGVALAKLIEAGVASFNQESKVAIELLASAEAGFEFAHMALYAAAARRRRGEMVGGKQGRILIEEADAWMAEQKIKNSERMTAMLAPGRWEKRL
jgi:eukaryotic-like serine/threonine-protein kinase